MEDIAKNVLKDADWLKDNVVEELSDSCKENAKAGQILWMFINIEMFRKKYFEKTGDIKCLVGRIAGDKI